MLHQFRNELRLRRREFLLFLAIAFSFYLLGICIITALAFSDGSLDDFACLGTAMAGFLYLFMSVFVRSMYYAGQFQMSLSMGRTRKEIMFLTFARYFLENLLAYILFLAAYGLEHWICTQFLGQNSPDLIPWIIGWILPALVLLGAPLLSMLIGTLYGRYGKKAVWIMYFLWLFLVMFTPRLSSATSQSTQLIDRLAYRLMQFLQALPHILLPVGIAVILAGFVCIIWKLGQKAMVK